MAEATLVLANGTVFNGISIGAEGLTIGEVVFNTSMTGYQEILTDPSYAQQLVTLTYPHIGNTGVNAEDTESDQIYANGLIVRTIPTGLTHFRSRGDLSSYLKQHGLVAIAEIDTRQLTHLLRNEGAQVGAIITGGHVSIAEVQQRIKDFGSIKGKDLVRLVSCRNSYSFTEGEWSLGNGFPSPSSFEYRVVVYDFGVKHNILRSLAARGCELTVVPADTSAQTVLELKPHGIVLSNGPGDPEPCTYAIEATKTFLKSSIPILGICLGHQLLALALGAKTKKMKFGHHGANHPVLDLATGQVIITSQNHSFVVAEETLPAEAKVTHVSLFDYSLQGFTLVDQPVFSFQGHPEASPGPQDWMNVFDQFVSHLSNYK
ncbi:MAG: glutamine-hydrolyzing carbamoyl-phosphate synthase small subunit [Neisseriaceae bacterium]